MASIDVRFSGSVPANYDRYMVPLLFEPYAEELAKRAQALGPKRILEIAAGTGVVTKALANALPDSEIIATDLNQAMLDVAKEHVSSPRVTFQTADALDLPFEHSSFDLVVNQFGIMFFPDKVRGNAQAHRVLREGGHYLIAIWDRIEKNVLTNIAQQSLQELFPEDPPMFMVRGPFSYHDPEWIERDLRAAGFRNVRIDTVERASRSGSAEEAARGLCYGSPMRVELEQENYGADALDNAFAEVWRGARRFEGSDGFEASMSAHVVTATK